MFERNWDVEEAYQVGVAIQKVFSIPLRGEYGQICVFENHGACTLLPTRSYRNRIMSTWTQDVDGARAHSLPFLMKATFFQNVKRK